jgi:hypothetical protein
LGGEADPLSAAGATGRLVAENRRKRSRSERRRIFFLVYSCLDVFFFFLINVLQVEKTHFGAKKHILARKNTFWREKHL